VGNFKSFFLRHEEWLRRSLVFTALYSFLGWLVLIPPFVSDSDIWWHLRIGQWVVQHHSVPYNDWFSSYGMGRPWAAYSWLFEILVYGLYTRFGHLGLLFFVYGMGLLITANLHRLIQRFEHRIANSIALTGLAIFAMAPLLTPRPWLFTILLFIIEFDILVSVRRSRNFRLLYILLPLFALWANIHIQFVYGLFVLGLAACEEPLNRLLGRRPPDADQDGALPSVLMLLIMGGCIIATLANPYHVRIYAVLLDLLRQGGLYHVLSELKAMEFRAPPDYFVLVLTLGAAFTLGRRQDVKPFWTLLFLASALLSFRSRRDVWFVVTIAVALIASSTSVISSSGRYILTRGQILFIIAAVGVLLVFTAHANHVSEGELQLAVARTFPVAAAKVVEDRGYPGPLYNHYDWGGYLMWRLPSLPVSIDGRNNIHDADRLRHTAEVWNGMPNWASDAELSGARVVIAEKVLPLTQLLRLDSRFELVYEDQLATVFIAKTP
jgi:hypothetical protein